MNPVQCSKCQSLYWRVFLNLDGSLTIKCICGVLIEKLTWGEVDAVNNTELDSGARPQT